MIAKNNKSKTLKDRLQSLSGDDSRKPQKRSEKKRRIDDPAKDRKGSLTEGPRRCGAE